MKMVLKKDAPDLNRTERRAQDKKTQKKGFRQKV